MYPHFLPITESESSLTYARIADKKFERYVRDFIIIDDNYQLLAKAMEVPTENEAYTAFLKMPTFLLRDNWLKKEFYVETAFINQSYNFEMELAEKIAAFNAENDIELPVFLVLGTGEDPDRPEAIYLVRINNDKKASSHPRFSQINVKNALSSRLLWSR